MLSPTGNKRPLDFDMSVSDFFNLLLPYNRYIQSDTVYYENGKLILKEPIGTLISAKELIYYPMLCKQLRTMHHLTYQVSINLNAIKSYKQNGLAAMLDSLRLIEEALYPHRMEKAKLDAMVNNLIFLYGQEKTIPILQEIKPYYGQTARNYRYQKTFTYQITISGVRYWINYEGKRFNALKSLYVLTERELLFNYFSCCEKELNAFDRSYSLRFLGGILNTPIFIFRVKQSYKHRGKKYYIDLTDNTTYTRLSDAEEKARTYTHNYQVVMIKES